MQKEGPDGFQGEHCSLGGAGWGHAGHGRACHSQIVEVGRPEGLTGRGSFSEGNVYSADQGGSAGGPVQILASAVPDAEGSPLLCCLPGGAARPQVSACSISRAFHWTGENPPGAPWAAGTEGRGADGGAVLGKLMREARGRRPAQPAAHGAAHVRSPGAPAACLPAARRRRAAKGRPRPCSPSGLAPDCGPRPGTPSCRPRTARTPSSPGAPGRGRARRRRAGRARGTSGPAGGR